MCKCEKRKYDFFIRQYNTTGDIPIVENCNAVTFTNIGDNTAVIDGLNGMQIFPGTVGSILGDSRTIGGNEGEILGRKKVNLAFTTTTAGQLVEVVQKFYTE